MFFLRLFMLKWKAMKPAEKPIVVRYKKLGRERVLGLADLDENTIIIDPRQPSMTFTGRNEGELLRGELEVAADVAIRQRLQELINLSLGEARIASEGQLP